jgi:streptogramin lyase
MSVPHVFRVRIPLFITIAACLALDGCSKAGKAQNTQMHVLAGTGAPGFSGDGHDATQAQTNQPFGVIRGADGDIYFCDTLNHRVRKIDADGTIETIVGSGQAGFAGDGGPAAYAMLKEPYEIRFDREGNLFIVERLNHTVRKVAAKTGVISTVAGTGKPGFNGDGGPGKDAQLNEPHSIQLDPAGNLYICDIKNHRIRKIDAATGVITTFSGNGQPKMAADGSAFANASLNGPRALDFDADGNLWLALREGNAVYKFDMKAGTLHHVAGVGGKPGHMGDGGQAKRAVLGGPKGISISPAGDVYLADTESNTIRKIDPKKGTIELVAGTGKKGSGAGTDPQAFALARPHGVFVDKDGKVLIGDSESHRVLGVW